MTDRILPYGRMEDRRFSRGRRVEDCSPLLGLLVFTAYGIAIGFLAGYLVRAWWG
jgi:hypothetical protein